MESFEYKDRECAPEGVLAVSRSSIDVDRVLPDRNEVLLSG
jgi:hypothetical protein